ncbi:MAG: hypothetical protein H9W81_13710 [Enterococcus sp.]|nr:hypothetical protein [Enterococcus sp.]
MTYILANRTRVDTNKVHAWRTRVTDNNLVIEIEGANGVIFHSTSPFKCPKAEETISLGIDCIHYVHARAERENRSFQVREIFGLVYEMMETANHFKTPHKEKAPKPGSLDDIAFQILMAAHDARITMSEVEGSFSRVEAVMFLKSAYPNGPIDITIRNFYPSKVTTLIYSGEGS